MVHVFVASDGSAQPSAPCWAWTWLGHPHGWSSLSKLELTIQNSLLPAAMSPYVLNCLKSSDSILFIYLSCIWQGTAKFKDFSQSLSVHMVECSPALKSIQQQTLKCHPKDQADSTCAVDGQKGKPTEDQISQILGAAISWHLDLEYVPQGGWSSQAWVIGFKV